MKKLILVSTKSNRLINRENYVYRTPKKYGDATLKGRYVTTTRFPKSGKRYKSIEAAEQEIAKFKKLNFLTSWEVVVIKLDARGNMLGL